MKKLDIVVFGLSLTSSWGNGHATTYRSLLKALAARGHRITFFERDVPWYAAHRDMPDPLFCKTVLYNQLDTLEEHGKTIENADLVIIGSYVQDAPALLEWVTRLSPPCVAFYDIDTPVTLAKLAKGDYEYLNPAMIPQFDLYLSFSGGPLLNKLEQKYNARRARALYCSVDPDLYLPLTNHHVEKIYDLGYLGTYSDDRQPTVDELLTAPARAEPEKRFCVGGSQYPADLNWPANIDHREHIPPHEHCLFYNKQRFTLNVTRRDMISAGYSPSVRLFEAGACGTPIISDFWHGLDALFDVGREILIADNQKEVLQHLQMPEQERLEMGMRLRERVMKEHTSVRRAQELEAHWVDATERLMAVSQ